MVVEGGCPNLFRKSVNSAKRLRAFVRLDEGDVCYFFINDIYLSNLSILGLFSILINSKSLFRKRNDYTLSEVYFSFCFVSEANFFLPKHLTGSLIFRYVVLAFYEDPVIGLM